ncbi:hypothetical protein RHMOL_Rhmol10G0042800 [Rhododendron molle]|uniref:Uncharacterized protein n=1 Tax=Rhododendron molle TaxID=49168 RepID=A0ACC0LZU0_RHOML|nr:hypothetical protein RHMOL_Rhmol10G0042800 [Rhododendron molle]
MAKGPGLYTDIGKKARDLLYKDYQSDHKFTITTYSPTGVAITSSAVKKGDLFLADVNTQLKNKNITTDIKVDTSSNLFTTITVDEPCPGLKTILSFKVPDQRSGKLELQYFHDYAGVSSSVGLTANPIVNFSGVVGTNVVALGTDVSFDTKEGNFTKCNAGNDKGETLNASYYHSVRPLTSTAVGGEISHSFSTNENTITAGTQHSLDPFTTVKARVNNFGKSDWSGVGNLLAICSGLLAVSPSLSVQVVEFDGWSVIRSFQGTGTADGAVSCLAPMLAHL